MGSTAHASEFQFPPWRALGPEVRAQRHLDSLVADLYGARMREEARVREIRELSKRQETQVRDYDHRLVQGLQLIASLLSLQSRGATTPEAAAQLAIAARRVRALARVHRRLHLLDHMEKVDFKQYLHHLCEDLSELLSEEQNGIGITVESAEVQVPSALAIPLGFIINELITNAAKHANGNITVRLETSASGAHSMSVMDDGSGVPEDFDPERTNGLGMKIVTSLTRQIGGELRTLSGDDGRGARFSVTFRSLEPVGNGA